MENDLMLFDIWVNVFEHFDFASHVCTYRRVCRLFRDCGNYVLHRKFQINEIPFCHFLVSVKKIHVELPDLITYEEQYNITYFEGGCINESNLFNVLKYCFFRYFSKLYKDKSTHTFIFNSQNYHIFRSVQSENCFRIKHSTFARFSFFNKCLFKQFQTFENCLRLVQEGPNCLILQK